MNITKPLKYEITHLFGDVSISKKERQRLFDIASWNGKVPFFYTPGRTAWEELQEPVSLNSKPELQFLAAKFKGVGYYNPYKGTYVQKALAKEPSPDPSLPTTIPFEPDIHMSIDDDGGFRHIWGSSAPIGGITYDRALRDYRVAMQLLKNGVPAIVPFAVIKYGEEFTFNGQPMGASILLSVEKTTHRIRIAFGEIVSTPGKNPELDKFYQKICENFDVSYQPACEISRLLLIKKIAKEIGASLREFHNAGLYRHSSAWINFSYSTKIHKILFTDLDSTRFVEEDGLSPLKTQLEFVRDLASALNWLIWTFQDVPLLKKYSLSNLLEYDPVGAFLEGYYPDAEQGELRYLAKRFYNIFIPHWFLLKRNYDYFVSEKWGQKECEPYIFDRDFFTVFAITCLVPVNERYGVKVSRHEKTPEKVLLQRAEAFLGDKYEYFLYHYNNGI